MRTAWASAAASVSSNGVRNFFVRRETMPATAKAGASKLIAEKATYMTPKVPSDDEMCVANDEAG